MGLTEGKSVLEQSYYNYELESIAHTVTDISEQRLISAVDLYSIQERLIFIREKKWWTDATYEMKLWQYVFVKM